MILQGDVLQVITICVVKWMRIFKNWDCKNNPGIETGVMGQQRVGTTIGRVFIISTIIYIAITVQLR